MRPSCSLLASVSATGPSGCRRGISQTYSARASLIQVPDAATAATSNLTVVLPCGREREKGRGKSFPGPPLLHASCRREKQEAGPRRRKPEDWAFPAAIADMSAPRTRLVRPSSSPRARPGTRISRIRPPVGNRSRPQSVRDSRCKACLAAIDPKPPGREPRLHTALHPAHPPEAVPAPKAGTQVGDSAPARFRHSGRNRIHQFLPAMAGDIMSVLGLKRRLPGLADVNGMRAARLELASRWLVRW